MRRRARLLAAGAVVWAAACGDAGPDVTGPPPSPNRAPQAVGAIPAQTVPVRAMTCSTALIAGVNIPENDPAEVGTGYGGLPNANGVVQLDACCMHGPRRWAGGVAALEGVRTPPLVARAVAELTEHHLLVGAGA